MKNIWGFLIGAVFGAIIGSAVALLFAPSSGTELRANIKSKADTQYSRLQDGYQSGLQQVQNQVDKLSSDLQAVSSRSKEA